MAQVLKSLPSTGSRRSQITSMPEAIAGLLEAYKIRNEYQESYIVYSWERVMGSPIAAKTSRLYVRKGILHIILTSPALKDHLIMSKSKIIEILNQDAGAEVIRDIVFL